MKKYLYIFAFLFSHYALAAHEGCTTHHCMVVVDAGSTKSYFHLYQYDLDEMKKPVHIRTLTSKKVEPGLATLTPERVKPYLDELFAEQNLAAIPVYFYATAGMRLLPLVKQQPLYQAVKAWFGAHAEYELREAKTITGQLEGVYAWLAVNGDRLPENRLGVMDMGGASVQVAFPVDAPVTMPVKEMVEFKLGRETIYLFSHSFLGLGQTEVVHQLMDEPACYAVGYPMPAGDLGEGQVNHCIPKLESLLTLHEVQEKTQALAWSATHQWFAMGGLAAFAQSFPFHFNHMFSAKNLLDEGTAAYCLTPWDTLNKAHPNDMYLATSCLASQYYYALIAAYGISANQSIEISQEGFEYDWTRGVLYYHGD